MTGVHVVSLKVDTTQLIADDDLYHVVRFPHVGEPHDPYGMHQKLQPDGYEVRDWQRDDRSGLIWPSIDGWGVLTANLHWEPGNYSELRDRFVRDPLNLADGYDSTATDHRPPSPGMQCVTKQHQMFVHPGVPVAVLVAHNASSARRLVFAEFKLAIHPNEGA